MCRGYSYNTRKSRDLEKEYRNLNKEITRNARKD